MRVYTIPAHKTFRVIVSGDLAAAAMAAGEQGIARPLRDVSYSRNAVHASVSCDRSTIEQWFAFSTQRFVACGGEHRAGSLCFYREEGE